MTSSPFNHTQYPPFESPSNSNHGPTLKSASSSPLKDKKRETHNHHHHHHSHHHGFSNGHGGQSRRTTGRGRVDKAKKRAVETAQALPIIDGRLYFMISRFRPKNNETSHFFCIDNELRYEPFFVDFGPLSMGCLFKFCIKIRHKLRDPSLSKSKIYFYCGCDPQRIANAAYLIGCFQVIELDRHAGESYHRIKEFAKRAVAFRDASMGLCTYRCTVEHCVWACYRAKQCGFINFDHKDLPSSSSSSSSNQSTTHNNNLPNDPFISSSSTTTTTKSSAVTSSISSENNHHHHPNSFISSHYNGWMNPSPFNVTDYEYYERVEYGDLNVMIPHKFIAFAGPHHKEYDDDGYPALTPDFYIPIWNKFHVKTIIRLNKKCYDRSIWVKEGFKHHDMFFIDGTTPSSKIVKDFLNICEKEPGMIAVHCKAGLGRTGSLLGCFFMKHLGWNAAECIAWLRMCRPGSVIGPQQQWLHDRQTQMHGEGDLYRENIVKMILKMKKTGKPYNKSVNMESIQRMIYPFSDSRRDDKKAWKANYKRLKKERANGIKSASSSSSSFSSSTRKAMMTDKIDEERGGYAKKNGGSGMASPKKGGITMNHRRYTAPSATSSLSTVNGDDESTRDGSRDDDDAMMVDHDDPVDLDTDERKERERERRERKRIERDLQSGLSPPHSPKQRFATDPGQRQGQALLNAKRLHSPIHSRNASPAQSPKRSTSSSLVTKLFGSSSKSKDKKSKKNTVD